MTDSEPKKKGWRDYLRRERHLGSTEVIRHEDQLADSESQRAPIANLNDPNQMLNKDGRPSQFATKPNVELDKKIKPKGFEI